MDINLKELSTPQLREMRTLILNGPVAKAGADIETKSEETVSEKEVKTMEDNEKIVSLEKDIADLKLELETNKTEAAAQVEKVTDLEIKATKLGEFTTEIETMKRHNDELVTYWFNKETEAERAKILKVRKAKIVEAGIELDIETEADKWLEMSDDIFDFTIKTLSNVKGNASASLKVDVPAITTDGTLKDNKTIIREALANHKGGK